MEVIGKSAHHETFFATESSARNEARMRVAKNGDALKLGVSSRTSRDERLPRFQSRTAGGAPGQMLLHAHAGREVQFAVEIRIDQSCRLFTFHGEFSFVDEAIIVARNRARARASRDITVPMGMPAMAAISL